MCVCDLQPKSLCETEVSGFFFIQITQFQFCLANDINEYVCINQAEEMFNESTCEQTNLWYTIERLHILHVNIGHGKYTMILTVNEILPVKLSKFLDNCCKKNR